jgi:hypothetical protein
MKRATKNQPRKLFLISFATSALVFQASVLQSQAQIVTLTDNNSVVQVNTGSSAGMSSWSVNGQNQLAQQWFWYRVGATGPEAPINTISAPTITTPNASTLYTSYANNSYGVQIKYSLTGGSAVSGKADMGESIVINNTSASALDFHFFQYSDFNLGGTTGGQTVQLGKNLSGLFNEALQTAPGVAFTETVLTPGANHGEAGLVNTTLVKLNDGTPTTLNDNAGPVGPGDATWAFEWDLSIAPGGSALISKDKYIQLQPIPEPSSLALISLGLAGCALIKRRRSK